MMPKTWPCAAVAIVLSGVMVGPIWADAFTDHVNVNVMRQNLISLTDLYNGGEDGLNGAGVYSGPKTINPNWNGLFQINLNRKFQQIPNYWNPNMSAISQARMIYNNTAAYRADPADGARFLTAATLGADYLFNKGYDTTYGGIYWGLDVSGNSPPTSYNQIAGTLPTHKNSYGQVQPVYAFAHAAQISGDANLLNDAYKIWDDYKTHFSDTPNGPGAFLPSQNRNYTSFDDSRNLDYQTHALEAMITLVSATPVSDPRRAVAQQDMLNIGNFMVNTMTQPVPGHPDQAYMPWSYDSNWTPVTGTTVSTGHQVELAYLLSRAADEGAPQAWRDTANKLLNFGIDYGVDQTPGTPYYGVMDHQSVSIDGSPLDSTSVQWWQQSELTRATMYFAAVGGRPELWTTYDASWAAIQAALVDPNDGSWFQSATWNASLGMWVPGTTDKGQVWNVGYHETNLYDEALRLASLDSSPVPEPASLGLLAVGALALLRRRRNV